MTGSARSFTNEVDRCAFVSEPLRRVRGGVRGGGTGGILATFLRGGFFCWVIFVFFFGFLFGWKLRGPKNSFLGFLAALGANMADFGAQLGPQNGAKTEVFGSPRGNLT